MYLCCISLSILWFQKAEGSHIFLNKKCCYCRLWSEGMGGLVMPQTHFIVCFCITRWQFGKSKCYTSTSGSLKYQLLGMFLFYAGLSRPVFGLQPRLGAIWWTVVYRILSARYKTSEKLALVLFLLYKNLWIPVFAGRQRLFCIPALCLLFNFLKCELSNTSKCLIKFSGWL